jgi:hypothetical protein
MSSFLARSEPGSKGVAAGAAAGGQEQDRDPLHGADIQEGGGADITPSVSGKHISFVKFIFFTCI